MVSIRSDVPECLECEIPLGRPMRRDLDELVYGPLAFAEWVPKVRIKKLLKMS